jgi:Flp pilus assembly protein CpaB
MNHNRLFSIGLPVVTLCALVSAVVCGILQIKTKVSQPPQADVLVATRDLQAEEIITDADVRVGGVQITVIDPGCLRDKSFVVGHKVILPVAKGNAICAANLAIENEDFLRRWPDMRAVSVPISEIEGPTSFLQRGAHVDVLQDQRGEQATTLFKNVCIVAIQAQEPEHDAVRLGPMPRVFLLFSPDDALKLARARRRGKIRLPVLHGFSSCV